MKSNLEIWFKWPTKRVLTPRQHGRGAVGTWSIKENNFVTWNRVQLRGALQSFASWLQEEQEEGHVCAVHGARWVVHSVWTRVWPAAATARMQGTRQTQRMRQKKWPEAEGETAFPWGLSPHLTGAWLESQGFPSQEPAQTQWGPLPFIFLELHSGI